MSHCVTIASACNLYWRRTISNQSALPSKPYRAGGGLVSINLWLLFGGSIFAKARYPKRGLVPIAFVMRATGVSRLSPPVMTPILWMDSTRAVTKFKGLEWDTYDEHFRCRAARDLTIAWDRIDIELWMVTFTGTAKLHCSICSSLYHQSDDCPHQKPSKKPRRSALVCFDFNKPSGCQRRTCHFPHNCRRCGSSSHALFNCPSSKQHATSTKSATPGDRSKK